MSPSPELTEAISNILQGYRQDVGRIHRIKNKKASRLY